MVKDSSGKANIVDKLAKTGPLGLDFGEWILFLLMGLSIGIGLWNPKGFLAPSRQPSIDFILLALLALITLLYAWHTRRLAQSAKEQTDTAKDQLQAASDLVKASMAQADATTNLAKQTGLQFRKSLEPRIQFSKELNVNEPWLAVQNVGFGPAVRLRCWARVDYKNGTLQFWSRGSKKCEREELSPGGSAGTGDGQSFWRGPIGFDVIQAERISYVAVYADVLGNFYRSELSAQLPSMTDKKSSLRPIEPKEAKELIEQTSVYEWKSTD